MLAVSNETETANISGRKFRGPVITAKEPKNTRALNCASFRRGFAPDLRQPQDSPYTVSDTFTDLLRPRGVIFKL